MSQTLLPLAQWTNEFAQRLEGRPSPVLDTVGHALGSLSDTMQALLGGVSPAALVAGFAVIGFWRGGWPLALLASAALAAIEAMGLSAQLRVSLGQTLTASVLTVLAGVPLGIWLGTHRWAAKAFRPMLDMMQTMPPFVYLIPAVMVFGLGPVPALLATVTFALPPVVRMTALGVSQVPVDVLEAAATLGATPAQVLLRVKLPMAVPSVMAGISQSIMMCLSMVIVASMVGAGGLGDEVLSAIQRLDLGQGVASGLGVVLLAVVVDRIAQSFTSQTARWRFGLKRRDA